jgi:hypothetical protein
MRAPARLARNEMSDLLEYVGVAGGLVLIGRLQAMLLAIDIRILLKPKVGFAHRIH